MTYFGASSQRDGVAHLSGNCILPRKIIFCFSWSKIQRKSFSHSIFCTDHDSDLKFTKKIWDNALCEHLSSRNILIIFLKYNINRLISPRIERKLFYKTDASIYETSTNSNGKANHTTKLYFCFKNKC